MNFPGGGNVRAGIELNNKGNVLILKQRPDKATLLEYSLTGSLLAEYDVDNPTGHATIGNDVGIIRNDKVKDRIWISAIHVNLVHANPLRWLEKGKFGIDSSLNRAISKTHVRCLTFDQPGNTWIGLSKIDNYRRDKADSVIYGGIVVYNENGVNLSNLPIGLRGNTTPFISEINIYPNPSKNFIQVTTNSHIPVDVIMYDVRGSAVLNRHVNSDDDKIQVGHLISGVYFLTVHNETGEILQTKKVVIR
jgi:hypothetical protein